MLQTTVDSLKINYMDKGSGELVVLLHGWGSNIELFENMSEHGQRGSRGIYAEYEDARFAGMGRERRRNAA